MPLGSRERKLWWLDAPLSAYFLFLWETRMLSSCRGFLRSITYFPGDGSHTHGLFRACRLIYVLLSLACKITKLSDLLHQFICRLNFGDPSFHHDVTLRMFYSGMYLCINALTVYCTLSWRDIYSHDH